MRSVAIFLVYGFVFYYVIVHVQSADTRGLNCVNALSGYYCDSILSAEKGYFYMLCRSTTEYPKTFTFSCIGTDVCQQTKGGAKCVKRGDFVPSGTTTLPPTTTTTPATTTTAKRTTTTPSPRKELSSERDLNCRDFTSGFYCASLTTPSRVFVRLVCLYKSAALHTFKCKPTTACIQLTATQTQCRHERDFQPQVLAKTTTPIPPKLVTTPSSVRQIGCSDHVTGFYCNSLSTPTSNYAFIVCTSKHATPTRVEIGCEADEVCKQDSSTTVQCVRKEDYKVPLGGRKNPAPRTTKIPPTTTTTSKPTQSLSKERVLDCANFRSGFYCESLLTPSRVFVRMICSSAYSPPAKYTFKCLKGTVCIQFTETVTQCRHERDFLAQLQSLKTSKVTTKAPIPTPDTNELKTTTTPLPTIPPVTMAASKKPMFVYFSIDDGITPDVYGWSMFLFKNRKNPNKCPVTVTYNVVKVNTKFELLKKLHDEHDYEINSHGITHRSPAEWWSKATKAQWEDEVVGMTRILEKKIGIPTREIKGMRAPFLEMGGDRVFEMLVENGFKYDASMVTGRNYWPFQMTKLKPNSQRCRNDRGCPTKAHALWEMPLNKLYDCPVAGFQSAGFAMLDQCQPATYNDALHYLRSNFYRYYTSTEKVPFGLNMHFAWFAGQYRRHNLQAMNDFLNEIQQLPDVWIVSSYKIIQWMEYPVTHEDMKAGDFPPVNC